MMIAIDWATPAQLPLPGLPQPARPDINDIFCELHLVGAGLRSTARWEQTRTQQGAAESEIAGATLTEIHEAVRRLQAAGIALLQFIGETP